MIELLKPYIRYSKPLSHCKFLYFLEVPVNKQKKIASLIKRNKGVLLTEWVSPNEDTQSTNWSTLYLMPEDGLYCVQSNLNKKHPALVDLSFEFPVCNRLQRAIVELTRIPTRDHHDKRAWLNHGHFPVGILNNHNRLKCAPNTHYLFQKVSGDGVHEIPVGPVHAGIIEPAHFRFSVVGERILKCEERLGYTHKGIHQLLKNKSIANGKKLIGRVSGDSTVAYSCAFIKACEQIYNYNPNQQTLAERAIALERERLCNHISDIGAIVNDAGLPSLQSSFACLKEQLLRHNATYLGHRYLMDCLDPFPTTNLFSSAHLESIKMELSVLEKALISLQKIVDNHFGLQDRLQNTGIISFAQAEALGLLGLVAKASGIDHDCRRIFCDTNSEILSISSNEIQTGDVAARVAVRFKESFDSIQLIYAHIQNILENKNHFKINQKSVPLENKINMGIGVVEGWRGPITVVLSIKSDKIEWCHFHDPSWQNWLALEYAVLDNIVADFPLINKSFNLSYSGHDS